MLSFRCAYVEIVSQRVVERDSRCEWREREVISRKAYESRQQYMM